METIWQRYGRMGGWGVVAIALIIVAFYAVGEQDKLLGLWKLTLIHYGAVLGYWIDRTAFPDGRPSTLGSDNQDDKWTKDDVLGLVLVGSWLRRAVVIVGTMVAIALAV